MKNMKKLVLLLLFAASAVHADQKADFLAGKTINCPKCALQ